MSLIQNMKTIPSSRAGFSLIELMVSVGIIGVLATVAVPQYSKFTNKAKQSEAKTLLGGIYMTEKAFFVEKNDYSVCLAEMGYSVDGGSANNRRYSVGFKDADARTGGGTTCTVGSGASNFLEPASASNATGQGAIPSVNPTSSTFTAGAVGKLRAIDSWTMDQAQSLTNVLPSGI